MNALILVDLQNDFMPGGALAVSEGDQVIAVANRLMPQFDLVVATQDWHPSDHGSFASQHSGCSVGDVIRLDGVDQVLWPDHCIQNSTGAALHANLNTADVRKTFPKGTDRLVDSYSGFFDNDRRQSTGLSEYLFSHDVRDVTIMGLATDYCVRFTALDAVELGFRTTLVEDGCRGVGLQPDDVATAIQEMQQAGVQICTSHTSLHNS